MERAFFGIDEAYLAYLKHLSLYLHLGGLWGYM